MKWRSVLLVLAALLAGVLLFYSLRRSAVEPARAELTELVSWSPEDSNFLLYADLVSWRASPFLRQLLARLPAPAYDREYAEFVTATGFDYSRDLDRLLIAGRRPPEGAVPAQTEAWTAIAEGRFNRERIHRVAMRSGRIEKQDGKEFYVVTAGSPAQTVAFAFLSDTRVALTEGPSLAAGLSSRRAALGPHPSPASRAALVPEELRERVNRVAGAAFFAVARMEDAPISLLPRGWSAGPLNKVLKSVHWTTLGAEPEADRVKLALEAECDSFVNAVQLAALLEGARVIGRRSLADPAARRAMAPELVAALEVLIRDGQVSREANRVTVRVGIPNSIFSSPPLRTTGSR